MARKTKNLPSIRIKLDGVLSPEELREKLNEAVDDLESQGGGQLSLAAGSQASAAHTHSLM